MHPADLHREVVGRVWGGGGGGRTDEGLEKSDGGWGGDDRQTAGGRKRQKNQRGPDRQTQQEETHLGEQVVQVAQAAAFFIDWDEVASPSTA